MPRKRKLDPYTSIFVDRHGKERCRFRKGSVSCYLPHPSAKGYSDAYEAALASKPGVTVQCKPRSVNDLLPRFYETIGFKRGGDDWRRTRRQVLEAFREEFGDDLVANFEASHIDIILARKMEKRVVDGRPVGGTSAALRLREQLELLFKLAVKLKWIPVNPVEDAEDIAHKGDGFYPWTEEDIAQFREFWPLGTKPRLAAELVLWTGARRGDAHRAVAPSGGRIKFKAGKTGKEQDVPVAPMLAAAIEAMPAVGLTALLVTEYGKPFTRAGFGNWFKDKCMKAGLPRCTLHGLRKALARRAADRGVQQQGLKALGQWAGDREVAVYVEGANQRRLAASALEEVAAWERDLTCI